MSGLGCYYVQCVFPPLKGMHEYKDNIFCQNHVAHNGGHVHEAWAGAQNVVIKGA